MATGAALWVLLAIFAAGAGLLGFGAIAVVQRLRLRRATRSDGGPLEPGVLAVRGRTGSTTPDDTVRSPITGDTTLLYEYAIQHRAGSSPTPDWRTVAGGQNGVPFRLETDGGAVLVDPDGAELELPVTDEVEFLADPDELDGDDPPLDALAVDTETETVVVGDVPLTNGERYRVVERRIEPGDELAVAGVASAADAPSATAAGESRDDDPRIAFRRRSGLVRQTLGVPYVIGDANGGADVRLRNRAIVGVLFGLPVIMLSGAYLLSP